jgi:hypothetical protein
VTAYAGARAVWVAMTAREKLRERIEALTEAEATRALRLLDLRSAPVIAGFRNAPVDEEPWSQQHETAAAGGRADLEWRVELTAQPSATCAWTPLKPR